MAAGERTEQNQALIAEQLIDLYGGLSADEQQALGLILAKANGAVDAMQLAALPPEALFDADECALIAELDAVPIPAPQLPSKPTIIMKATRLCNLRCTYCNAWAEGPDQQMGFEALARMTHGLLRDPAVIAPSFVWHGGEPTMRGIEFYLRALWLQLHWRRSDQNISNALQSNATRLTPEFIEMCRRFRISISISLDGPPEIHDLQRLDAAGRPTSERVRAGLEMLRAGGLNPAILMVVDERTVQLGAQRVLDYLLELEISTVGLLNAVPDIVDGQVNPNATWLPWGTWQSFLHDMFRLWWPEYADQLHIRELSGLLTAIGGGDAFSCHHYDDCFSFAFTLEPNGTVSPCDKYVGDATSLYGSILESPVGDVLIGAAVQAKREMDSAQVAELDDCRWFSVCRGSCPFDRAVNAGRGADTPDGCCGLGPLLDDMAAATDGRQDASVVKATYGPATVSTSGAGTPVTLSSRPRQVLA